MNLIYSSVTAPISLYFIIKLIIRGFFFVRFKQKFMDFKQDSISYDGIKGEQGDHLTTLNDILNTQAQTEAFLQRFQQKWFGIWQSRFSSKNLCQKVMSLSTYKL